MKCRAEREVRGVENTDAHPSHFALHTRRNVVF
jgi:hypothetical protein